MYVWVGVYVGLGWIGGEFFVRVVFSPLPFFFFFLACICYAFLSGGSCFF